LSQVCIKDKGECAKSNQSNTSLFLHLLVFFVVSLAFVALKRKAIGLALRDKVSLCSTQAIKFLCEYMEVE
jgi:hypothetical protein